jgi:hypothetical protein
MKRPRLHNTLIGNVYPFFLNNQELKNSYYLYQVVSPSYLGDQTPLISFAKIAEKTTPRDFSAVDRGGCSMYSCDLLATLLKSRKNIRETSVKYLMENILGRGGDANSDAPTLYENGYDFPMYELDWNNSTTKALIIGLRDALRWQLYRFAEGNQIDLLLTEKTYGVFKIKGEKDMIWLEPIAAYQNSDVEQKEPLDVDFGKYEYPKTKFSGKSRASDMNRALRQFEWRSFDSVREKETVEA